MTYYSDCVRSRRCPIYHSHYEPTCQIAHVGFWSDWNCLYCCCLLRNRVTPFSFVLIYSFGRTLPLNSAMSQGNYWHHPTYPDSIPGTRASYCHYSRHASSGWRAPSFFQTSSASAFHVRQRRSLTWTIADAEVCPAGLTAFIADQSGLHPASLMIKMCPLLLFLNFLVLIAIN